MPALDKPNLSSDVSSTDPDRCTPTSSIILFQPNPTAFPFSTTNSAVAMGTSVENAVTVVFFP
jgi:hypothetical protein